MVGGVLEGAGEGVELCCLLVVVEAGGNGPAEVPGGGVCGDDDKGSGVASVCSVTK